jgi:hypothetical protein
MYTNLFECTACQCEQSTILGNLGGTVWVRCRACGLDQTANVDVITEVVED